MKLCYRCKQQKELIEFAKNKARKDGLNAQCRACQSVLRKEHYNKNKKKIYTQVKEYQQSIKQYIRDLKESTPCMDCNIQYPYYVMDFDHREDKKFQLSRAIDKGFLQIQKEIKKCDLVCANCHRIRTHKYRDLAGLAHVGRASGFQPEGEGIVTLNPHQEDRL